MVIGGQDGLLDLLASYLTAHPWGQPVLRAHIGSYNGLIALYRGEVQVAATHLWDGDSGEYNLPYVRRLLPGVKTMIVRLAWRTQGLFVAKGNPLDLKSWHDLARPGLTLINRDKGAGSRVLIDEHLRRMGIWGRTIKGYDHEAQSPHTVAAAVGRGEADVAVGHSKASDQMPSVDFIPLQQECYDLAIKKEDLNLPVIRALLEILRSEEFRREFEPLSGYDLRDMGEVVAET
jgi:putative molybdopterin biosynthesis protein